MATTWRLLYTRSTLLLKAGERLSLRAGWISTSAAPCALRPVERRSGPKPSRRRRDSADTEDSTTNEGDSGRLIWEGYKRNFKGAIPPAKTRLRCKRGKDRISGNPCPICQSSINVKYTDTKLLKQFICPHTDQILPATKTGVCRQQQKRIEGAVQKARDFGLLLYTVPRKLPDKDIRIMPWNKIDVR